MKSRIFLFVCLLILISAPLAAQHSEPANVRDIEKILPERERAELYNEMLEWRLDNILPEVMRRTGIDMWIVICREYVEDPVFFSLVPQPTMAARRTTVLIFHDRGPGQGVDRLTGSFYGMGGGYEHVWTDKSLGQFENLAQVIRERDPKKIGINVSKEWQFGDGLTAGLRDQFEQALDQKYRDRIVSAEYICVGWLETLSPQQLSVYRHICGIAHDIISEFFSNTVITPDVTTAEEVRWWIRQRMTDIGVEAWFQPSLDIYRSPADRAKYGPNDGVIRRGDMLHCDIGIVYLGLCTDTQEIAYVCRIGEEDAPEGLKEGLRRGNRVQDIFMNEFRHERTGNEILASSLQKAKAEGLIPSIYTHPLNVHGHAAGPTIGMWDKQEGVPVEGDYPLYYNTTFAIELNSKYNVPEWDGMLVTFGLEEGGVFTKNGAAFIDGRQENFYIIR